jgi:hypothetical protein
VVVKGAPENCSSALLGLFSLVRLLAHRHMAEGAQIVRKAAW